MAREYDAVGVFNGERVAYNTILSYGVDFWLIFYYYWKILFMAAKPAKIIKRGDRKQFREQSEFEQKMIDLRRVARVESGGRRFSFRAAIVAGNRKGKVGIGVGKGADTALAMEKAFRDAKKHAITIVLTKDNSIPHDVEARLASVHVLIRRAQGGSGLVAGSAVRTVLDFAGVQNATAKLFSRTKNKINNARAALKALEKVSK